MKGKGEYFGTHRVIEPQGLLPQQMLQAIHQGQLDRFEKKYYGMECISCGTCTFTCPAKRPLTQLFAQTKPAAMAWKREQDEKKKEGKA